MIVGVYYLIKGQREKTATKRDNEKQTLEMALALQAKDIENLKSQVNMLSGRWDTLQEILGKINENLSAIRENISSFEKRLDRVEREKFNQS
jgi:septal ring factor EnvC (AmiA/AmiB activator)